jgi:sigma-B regulation protein RsbU (phosphoserine phosphatase)
MFHIKSNPFFHDTNPIIFIFLPFTLIYGSVGIVAMVTGQFIVYFIYNLTSHSLEPDKAILFPVIYSLLVYFLGYFNYKLFYTFNFKNKQTLLRLDSVKNLIKFVLVSIIMFLFNLYSIIFVDIELFSQPFDNIVHFSHPVFFIVFDLLIILLIMLTFNLFNLKVYKPKKSKFFLNHSRTFNILIIISFIILIIQIVYIILFKGFSNIIIRTIFFNIVLIMLFVIFKPITKDIIVQKANNSFNELIVFIFIFICTVYFMTNILRIIINGAVYRSFNSKKELIESIMGFDATMKFTILFISLIIILNYIQNNFSKHLHSLYKITKDYDLIKINNMDDENNDSKNIEDILYDLKNLSNSKYEVGQLADSLKDMIEDIELYITNLKKVTTEKEKMVAELDMAHKIQNSLIPNIFPPFPDRLNDFDIYASFNPARNVGGDFYDYFLIDDDHLVIVIGDVSGKGVPAALFMMIAKSLISYLINSGLSPSEAFYQLNNQLFKNSSEGMFVTAWLGILEINSGKLTYVNAGHNLPYLFSKSTNQYNVLKAEPNFVLGGMDNIKFIQHETILTEGDRLYLYTDGITETINQNDEEFSDENLLNLLNDKSNYSIKDLILEISNEIHKFSENMKQFDDETMLLLEYRRKNR